MTIVTIFSSNLAKETIPTIRGETRRRKLYFADEFCHEVDCASRSRLSSVSISLRRTRALERVEMRRSLSTYLDLLRFVAAFGVVLSHAKTFVLPCEPGTIASNGPECVAVFFVLSGFVIRFVTVEKGEGDLRTYAISRIARIYPVAALALLMTLTFDSIGYHFNPQLYDHARWYMPANLPRALAALSFTNEVWFTHSIFSSDEPYWSLGFEVPYYVLFGVVLFVRPRWRLLCILVWVAVYGPKITADLSIWLLGVALFEYLRRAEVGGNPLAGVALFVAGPVFYLLVKAHGFHSFHQMYKPTSMRDLILGAVYYFMIGCAIAMNISGFDRLVGERRVWPAGAEHAIRWLAGGSFTLYLVHLPFLIMVRAVFPSVVTAPVYGIASITAAVIVCYLIAEIGERRKRSAKMVVATLFSI
jgi:peptidoglycan/LPS O-acetylase OafA/YrhL